MSTVAHLPVAPAPTSDRLEKLLTDGHRGIALHCPDAASAHAVAGWPEGSWKLLADRGALVSFNATPEAHPGLAELVKPYTGCQFLFSHVGQPGRYQSPPTKDTAAERLSALLELSSAANCWVKISALYSISDRSNAYPYPEADRDRPRDGRQSPATPRLGSEGAGPIHGSRIRVAASPTACRTIFSRTSRVHA